MLRALIADDEPAVSKLIRYFIQEEQIPIEVIGDAGNGKDALDMIVSLKPDLVFIDIQMPLMTGLEVIEKAKSLQCTCKFIIITAYSVFEYAQTALRLGADDMLLKPLSRDQLLKAINRTVGMQFTSNRQVNDILVYMDSHLADSLTLQDIADHFFISTYHLSHLFKKYVNRTCNDCIHWLRIEKAKKLMQETNLSIKEVAEQTGYSNLNNFYMHFKKQTGVTPKAFMSNSTTEE